VQCSGWCVVCELDDGVGDPAPSIRTLVEKRLKPIIARFAKVHVKVAADGIDIDR
jgi:hypothetical protein